MVSLDRAQQVRHRADVAMFAGEARFQGGEIQFMVDDGVGRVASETGLGIFFRERAADRFFKRLGRHSVVSHGEVQAIHCRVIADQALVHLAIVLDHPGLGLCAHGPQNRKRDGPCAVAHAVLALTIARVYRVRIGTIAEGHLWMRDQVWIVSRDLHGAAHLRCGLGEGLGTVATCTGHRPGSERCGRALGLGGSAYAAQHEYQQLSTSLHLELPLDLKLPGTADVPALHRLFVRAWNRPWQAPDGPRDSVGPMREQSPDAVSRR